MKTLLISPDFPPPFEGGSLVYIHNLIKYYPEPMDVLTVNLTEGLDDSANPFHRLIRKKYLVQSFAPSRLQLLVNYIYISAWSVLVCVRRKYDVIIANAGLVGNCLIATISKMFMVPVLGVGYAEELTMPLKGKGYKNFIKRRLMLFAYPKFSGFIPCCPFTGDVAHMVGISKSKMRVFPVMFSENKSCDRSGIKYNQNFKVLSVGRLVKRKGFDLLIEAVRILKKDIPEVELNIVGRGPEYDTLKDLVAKYGLEKHVHLKGNLSDQELAEAYKNSSVFVLAHYMLENGDTEGCPTVFVEAEAYGLPVIGGVEGGASAVIEDNVNGYLVDPKNINSLVEKIRQLLVERGLAERMGEAGIQKVKNDLLPIKAGKNLFDFITSIVAK